MPEFKFALGQLVEPINAPENCSDKYTVVYRKYCETPDGCTILYQLRAGGHRGGVSHETCEMHEYELREATPWPKVWNIG